MTMEIIWHDPPPKTTGKYGTWFIEFTEALKANPNQWGELPPFNGTETYSNTVQTTLRKNFPAFEFAARPVPGNPNRIRLWGRYPEPEDDDDTHPSRNGSVLRSVGRAERVAALAANNKNGK